MKKQIKAVDARGRKLGGDTPLLCAPLVGRTRARLLAEATRVLAQKPDLVEWRVDFFDAIGDAGAVVEAARALRDVVGKRPVVFTCRAESGGGERIALGREATVALYEAVAASGLVDFVDFELDNDPAHVRRVRESTRRRSRSQGPATPAAASRVRAAQNPTRPGPQVRSSPGSAARATTGGRPPAAGIRPGSVG